jgi:hypothetical protein
MRTVIPAAFIVLAAIVNVYAAAIEEHYEENPITIQRAGPFEAEKQVIIRAGESIKFKIKVYQDTFFGYTIINANAKIDNASDQKVKAVYSISFHDKDDKLVGCRQGSWELKPNEDVNYGSAIIYADEEAIASITKYKLRTEAVKSKKK